MNQVVLVTGGAGFIGSHLVRRLASENHVRVFDNFQTGRTENLASVEGVEIFEGDVRSAAAVRQAADGVSAVFHVAALPSVARSWTDPVQALATNAHGTAKVLEAADAAGAEVFVYSSSSSIYGDQPEPLKSERLEPKPISPYGYSKLMGEMLTLAHARDTGMRVVALRYFNVFGPRQDPNSVYSAVIPKFIKHALSSTTATIYGDGTQTRDFTFVDNVVEANLKAWRSGVTGVALNIAAGENRSLLDVANAISEITGRPLHTEFSPAREGDIKHSQADIALAKKLIGYCPTVTFMDGLRKTIDSYRSN